MAERGKIDTSNTHMHAHSRSWFDTGISVKSGGLKLVFWSQITTLKEMIQNRLCTMHFQQLHQMLEMQKSQLHILVTFFYTCINTIAI